MSNMSGLNKISIQVGEFEFESEGSQIEVDEKFARFKEEGFWEYYFGKVGRSKRHSDRCLKLNVSTKLHLRKRDEIQNTG